MCKHAFLRDSVHLIAHFIANLSTTSHLNVKLSIYTLKVEQHAFRNSHTFQSHFCLQVIHIFKTIIHIFMAPLHFLTYLWQTNDKNTSITCLWVCCHRCSETHTRGATPSCGDGTRCRVDDISGQTIKQKSQTLRNSLKFPMIIINNKTIINYNAIYKHIGKV